MSERSARVIGLLVGLSLGQWVGRRARDRVATWEPPGLIDWGRARELAVRFAGEVRLGAKEREEATATYRRLIEELAPAIATFVGAPVPPGIHRVYAFDRIDWIDANLEGFAEILRPLETLVSLPQHPLARVGALAWAYAGRSAATVEIGMALGFLSRRVLGQYDITILGREPVTTGKLYFVEPNVRWLIRTWRLPEADFRRWLVLHEVTHAFEFETYPWLREHVNGLLREWVEALRLDGNLGRRFIEAVRSATRGEVGHEGTWIELLMSPEQRRLFRALQAVMAVIEGYSNFVMRQVGRHLVSEYEVIERKFEERERMRTPAEQLVLRLTGLDIKLEQYRRGEMFCRTIAERYGRDALTLLWRGPDCLPSYTELSDPIVWLQRVRRSSEQHDAGPNENRQ
ncbi:zinc-dependent metalloprotease [Thermomicrobium sp. CFH 73360]|uniref:zinc-dependent metalloprotease n=1 Tax=Thermomicrobium sp. CFH 73360 TaxID=2951987 RepID=UPI002077861C|nr:zinc-dependent metalloprotease [Thermomicrobium sp. CFH 73360]MCM8746756.1 zinc-dependent metalloprotease [Thermomicrobium sp. CFH 73360]